MIWKEYIYIVANRFLATEKVRKSNFVILEVFD